MFNNQLQTLDTKILKIKTNVNLLETEILLNITLRRVMEEVTLKFKEEVAHNQLDNLLLWSETAQQIRGNECQRTCLEEITQQQLLLSSWVMLHTNLHNLVNSSSKSCSTWWTARRTKMKFTLCSKHFRTLRCILEMVQLNQGVYCNLLIILLQWKTWGIWSRIRLLQLLM